MLYFTRDRGGAHNKKTVLHIYNKGMIPIEKNIVVVDEQGNKYEATYPKRAKGLVKNGRARFIDENTICLACPPNNELEDKIMSENKKAETVNNNEAPKEKAEATAKLLNSIAEQHSEKLTIDYILGKLEEISVGQAFATDAILELGKMKSGGPGDVGTQEQAKAVGEIIKAREATNQKLIALYEKMYDDLTSKQTSLKKMAMKVLERAADDEGKLAAVSDLLDTIRHLG